MKGLAPSRFDAVEGALGESLRDSHHPHPNPVPRVGQRLGKTQLRGSLMM